MNSTTESTLGEILEGDPSQIEQLRGLDGAELADAYDALGRPVVKRETVVRVLEQFLTGAISASQAQAWGELIRFSGFWSKGNPAKLESADDRFDIDWEGSGRDDDPIVEALARLEDISRPHGEFGETEARQLISSLG